MEMAHELDLQIDRAPTLDNYLHIHWHPLLPEEVRVWVNGEKIRITLAEAEMIALFLQSLGMRPR